MTALLPTAGADLELAPRWQQAIQTAMAPIITHRPRSWDLWGDVVSPAYDTIRDDMNEAIAITAAFVEYLSGDELTNAQRRLVAIGIRTHGKAFAYGLAQAIGTTTEFTPEAWFRYARAVARRILTDQPAR